MTFIRLLVLIPAALLMALLGMLAIGFAGWSFFSVPLAALFVGWPIALIIWTIRDHRKRSGISQQLEGMNP
jgi:ABC-type bacteriocin/lantibiotic exporter with double-glycine peptidase domain